MPLTNWKKMIAEGNTAKVVMQMIEVLSKNNADDYLNLTTSVSSRQADLKDKVKQELITDAEARVSQNKINSTLLMILDDIRDDGILPQDLEIVFDKKSDVISDSLSLEELKKRASLTLEQLKFLRKEQTMTFGKAEFILQNQIEETEKELDELKNEIANFKK